MIHNEQGRDRACAQVPLEPPRPLHTSGAAQSRTHPLRHWLGYPLQHTSMSSRISRRQILWLGVQGKRPPAPCIVSTVCIHGRLTWEQPARIARGLNVAEQGLYRERLGGVCRLPGVSNPFRCGSRRLACSIVRLCVCRSLAPILMTWGRPLLYNGCRPETGRSLGNPPWQDMPRQRAASTIPPPLGGQTILPQRSCAFALGRGISRLGAFAPGSTAPSRG